MSLSRFHRSSAWKTLSRKQRQILLPICHVCGGWIDLNLHHGDKYSWTLDHIVSVDKGGAPLDPANTAPAHRTCNGRKSNRDTPSRPHVSRPW